MNNERSLHFKWQRIHHLQEPKLYLPIIPTIYLNGHAAMSRVGKEFLPNYNPRDLIEYVRQSLTGQEESDTI